MRPLSSCRWMLVLVALLGLTRCAPARIDCSLTMITQLPLEVQDGLLVVPADINGKRVRMIVDTGAERTTITASAAEELGLPQDERYTTRSQGIGGVSVSTDVIVDRLELGGVAFPLERAVAGNFELRNGRGLKADGLLGADILLASDLDIDVPRKKLSLYRASDCPVVRLPWRETAAHITGGSARKDRLLLPFELDGVAGSAILDTGAQHHVLGMDMAQQLDLNSRTMALDPPILQHGVGPAEVVSHLHQFKSLRIGPVVQKSPRLMVLDTQAGLRDALIGAEFLHERRVWISFQNRQVYVAPGSSGLTGRDGG